MGNHNTLYLTQVKRKILGTQVAQMRSQVGVLPSATEKEPVTGETNILFAVHEGAPFVGHDVNDHNRLQKGRPLNNAITTDGTVLHSLPDLGPAKPCADGSEVSVRVGYD
jgi:hypothetical protein